MAAKLTATAAVEEPVAGESRGQANRKGRGAGKRTRTSDPRITNALLYQLSYPCAGGGELYRVAVPRSPRVPAARLRSVTPVAYYLALAEDMIAYRCEQLWLG